MIVLPLTQNGYDSVWGIINQWTKFAQVLPLKITCSAFQYAMIYLEETISYLVVLISTIFDSKAQSTTSIWKSFKSELEPVWILVQLSS